MITRYGMNMTNSTWWPWRQVTNQYLGGGTSSLSCSPETQARIDGGEEVVKLIKEQYEKAVKILSPTTAGSWMKLAQYLLCRKETITGDEFMEILERKELPEAEPQA